MKTRTNDIVVGLSVIVVIVATMAAIAWVQQSDFGERRHDVVARVRDVGNARVGNAVVIRGVIAGRVQSIELAPAGWVHLNMKLDPKIELPADPVVLLNESSLFGEWQAMITERGSLPADDAVRTQIAEASGSASVLAGAALPGIGKLTAVAGQISGDVANVARRVQVAFDDKAARELRASIRNVSDLSSTLAQTVRSHASDLDTIALELRTAVASVNQTASNVRRMGERVQLSADSGGIKAIVDNVNSASADLRRTSAQVRDLSERFTQTQRRLDNVLAQSDSVIRKVNAGQGSLGLFVNDASLYRRSDSLLIQLQALITDIKANPRKYLKLSIF